MRRGCDRDKRSVRSAFDRGKQGQNQIGTGQNNIRKNRKEENNTREKYNRKGGRKGKREQWSIRGAERRDGIKLNRRQTKQGS